MLPLFHEDSKSVAMIRHSMDVIKHALQVLNPAQVPMTTLAFFSKMDKLLAVTWCACLVQMPSERNLQSLRMPSEKNLQSLRMQPWPGQEEPPPNHCHFESSHLNVQSSQDNHNEIFPGQFHCIFLAMAYLP